MGQALCLSPSLIFIHRTMRVPLAQDLRLKAEIQRSETGPGMDLAYALSTTNRRIALGNPLAEAATRTWPAFRAARASTMQYPLKALR